MGVIVCSVRVLAAGGVKTQCFALWLPVCECAHMHYSLRLLLPIANNTVGAHLLAKNEKHTHTSCCKGLSAANECAEYVGVFVCNRIERKSVYVAFVVRDEVTTCIRRVMTYLLSPTRMSHWSIKILWRYGVIVMDYCNVCVEFMRWWEHSAITCGLAHASVMHRLHWCWTAKANNRGIIK